MEKGPLVSIVVPVYNVKLYLEQCVDSIRSQTLSNIEILLIDDGSTDGSSEIQIPGRESHVHGVLEPPSRSFRATFTE